MDEDLKAELTCPICMDLFSEPRRLPCGHVYCRTCLQDMLTRKYLHTRSCERILSCPECRQRYDLTFREAGVDCFPRDFKLLRLVELYEKKFACNTDAGDCSGGGDKGDDEQTAVKTVCHSESSKGARETSPAVESASHPPAARQLSREQLEAGLHSFGSAALTLSDDSWIYVSPSENRRDRPVPLVIGVGRRERGDDSWLLPSAHAAEARFPVGSGLDVRGSGAGVDYRTPGHADPNLNISGNYENQGHETFQRYAVEPVVEDRTVTRVAAAEGSTSESSSETASSDERGEEGSGEEVSESASEGSQHQNRRSRLTRFFRSLVLSDSETYDEDEEHGSDVEPRRIPPHRNFQHQPHPQALEQGSQVTMSLSVQRSSPTQDLPVSSGERTSQQGVVISFGAEVHTVPHSVLNAGERQDPSLHPAHSHSHSHMLANPAGHTVQSSAGLSAALGNIQMVAQNGVSTCASGGVGLSTPSTTRGGREIEADSDDSEDYEAQTSMLRPRRKPRSRLKKFFTSLLSLSSSDEEEEPAVQPPPTATPERN